MPCIMCKSMDNGTIINGEIVCSECMGNYATVSELKYAVEKLQKKRCPSCGSTEEGKHCLGCEELMLEKYD